MSDEGGSTGGEDLYRRLVRCGVDGVLTDYPAAWLERLNGIEWCFVEVSSGEHK